MLSRGPRRRKSREVEKKNVKVESKTPSLIQKGRRFFFPSSPNFFFFIVDGREGNRCSFFSPSGLDSRRSSQRRAPLVVLSAASAKRAGRTRARERVRTKKKTTRQRNLGFSSSLSNLGAARPFSFHLFLSPARLFSFYEERLEEQRQ